jgi:hypothetical protein
MQKSYSEVYSTSVHTFVSMAAVTVGATARILSSKFRQWGWAMLERKGYPTRATRKRNHMVKVKGRVITR